MSELAAAWREADVLVLRAPVGSGKSWLAHAVARWAGGAAILTPTNLLVRQYLDTWPALGSIGAANTYGGGSAWEQAKAGLRAAPVRVLNYYQYLAHRAYAPVVVFDEAHRLVPMLQELEASKLWLDDYPLPDWVRTTTDLAVWARSHPGEPKLVKLAEKLAQHPDTFVIELGAADFKGRSRPCLFVKPLTPRHHRPLLWPPGRVRKLVMMSATFHAEDLYDLGLEGRRVRVIDCASPIPATNRPVVYEPVGSLGRGSAERTLPALQKRLLELLARHPDRGVIHATYELARALRAGLGGHPRLVWHSADNAGRVYRDWLAGAGRADGKVLVASGMTEGLDLMGDRARWQAICKVTYPSQADTAVLAKLQLRPDWYSWQGAKDLIQASGRVCRGPDDYGKTYVLDSQFAMLYTKHRDMFPQWFQDALR